MLEQERQPHPERSGKDKMLSALIDIFGSKYVTNKPHDLYPYSYDATESEAVMPDFIVIPQSVEEIIKLVKLCNEKRIPIVPYVSGNNVGGLTIPLKGGIICDMGKRMRRILKVDDSMMYALVEPGVTWQQLKSCLDEHHPKLKYGYTYAPPYASVLANSLLSGMSNLSTSYGCMADWLNGLEVILNDGSLVRTGSCFISREMKDDTWFTRYPIPDLSALFTCWQGSTGIATKVAVQLWPKKPFNTVLVALVYGPEECTEVVKEVGRTGCCEDVSAMNIEIIKMTFGQRNPPKYEKEPDFGIIMTISGHTEELLLAKARHVKETFDRVKENTKNVMKLTNFATFVDLLGEDFAIYHDLPTVITPLVECSGVTWVGCYASTDHVGSVFTKSFELFKANDREPLMFMKSMKESHYCALMAILRYDQFEELEKVRQLQHEFLTLMLDHDCLPYKAPRWMAEIIRERCDPNWVKLLERVKKTMDPNNIFNPGRWGMDF